MNKEQLAAEVAGQTQLTNKAIRQVLDATTGAIGASLEKKKPVMLIGFGTFNVAKHRARMVNHPQTGKPLKIDAKHVPVFRPGSRLKKRIAARSWPGRPRKRR